jgi:YfiH family protein
MDDRNLQSIILPDWQVSPRVFSFVTTRIGGASSHPFNAFNLAAHVGDLADNVDSNRQLLARLLPSDISLQWLDQVHGVDVVKADDCGVPRADAAVVTTPGRAVVILTADCLPVLLASKDGAWVGAAHAGWRGLANGILEKTLATAPVPPSSITAWLGPAIGPCHFEVGAEVRNMFLSAANDHEQMKALSHCFSKAVVKNKYYADLYAIARIRLGAVGVKDVSGGEYCTYCDPHRFFSFRREALTGRMASVIGILSTD